ATAFRPVEDESLRRNPFRVFTSLLRLELIEDDLLREQARQILNQRQIFSDLTVALVEQCEREGGLLESEANRFVSEVLNTFRWHRDATVDAQTYHK
ncbi:DUF1338 family protein, partial [Staphylococcus aureus]|nr:DUF1338 family protein [Staphylococcus aureus]